MGKTSLVSGSFLERANAAAFWEAWVGAVLARAGLFTLHHPFVVDGGDYHSLSWDLDVFREDGPKHQVEVKATNLEFSTWDTYPHTKALVCSLASWKRKWHKSDFTQRHFLFVSQKTGGILWLPAGTMVDLTGTITDRSRGETYGIVRTEAAMLRNLQDFVEFVRDE